MTSDQTMIEGRSAPEVLAWSRHLVEPHLYAAVQRLPTVLQGITGYHLGWCDQHGEPVRSGGGKAMRPALVLLAAEAVGGSAEAAAPAAVAVELAHNYSLLHDDLIDGDETRRHRPTVWTVFGSTQAILAGDCLQALAFDVLAAADLPAGGMRLLSTALLDLSIGQSADVDFEQRTTVPLAECLDMVCGKTAALFGCACGLGALAGGAAADRVEQMRCFGAQLGLAFQIADDMLGIWGDPASTGKPCGSDLARRKKSLPVVAALTSSGPAARELGELYQRDQPLSDAELARAAELVERAGGRSWAQDEAARRLARAAAYLQATQPVPVASQELFALADLITKRND